MCSQSPKDWEKSSKSTSCCPGTFSRTRRFLGKKLDQISGQKSKSLQNEPERSVEVIEVIGGQNNENLPPMEFKGGKILKKKYTINKKRSAKDSFDRLRQHVPAIKEKNDVSQLDVLLEAIQYIQTLRKDLGKEDKECAEQQLKIEEALATLTQHTKGD